MAAGTQKLNAIPVPSSYRTAVAVTPADGADLARPARALYIGVAGALKVTTYDGQTVVFANVAAGILPLAVTRVFSTGTAATGIVALD